MSAPKYKLFLSYGFLDKQGTFGSGRVLFEDLADIDDADTLQLIEKRIAEDHDYLSVCAINWKSFAPNPEQAVNDARAEGLEQAARWHDQQADDYQALLVSHSPPLAAQRYRDFSRQHKGHAAAIRALQKN